MTLASAVLAGDRLALSRLLTQIENDTPTGREALNALFPHTGQAHLVGVTGAPGTGKSSLVNQLARYIRHPAEGEARKVAIVAVDPSSPFTGGAILGDRIRMRDLSGDPGVFIRSMASRGTLGGLAAATSGVVQALDAAGFDFVIIETVGAGQAEVDIARLAHTTLVIEAPGLGDEIQAIKAGILEIADILVVNKADLPGAENTERALRNMLNLAHPVKRIYHDRSHKVIEEKSEVQPDIWFPPIIRTVATEDTGFPELAKAIDQHRSFLQKEGEWERRDQERMQSELELLLRETLVRRWREGLQDGRYPQVLDRLYAREISPRQAVAELTSDA